MILNKSKSGLDWQAGDQGGVTVLHLAQRHSSKKLLQVADKRFPCTNVYISLNKVAVGKVLDQPGERGREGHQQENSPPLGGGTWML